MIKINFIRGKVLAKRNAIPLLLLCNIIITTATYSQIATNKLDTLVETAMNKFSVAGVAVGIVKDGKVIYLRGYGLKSIAIGEKLNEYTNFGIGSNSIAFTTTALSIFEEEARLGWNGKVIKYIS